MNNLPETKKSLGQHWLHDTESLEAICDAAGVHAGDVTLEIGPGTGELTARLLERGAEVVALEIDQNLLLGLRARFASYDANRFFLQEGDIRTYDLGNMPENYKIVANIPYYLTNHLLRILTETAHPPERTALLVQKEVAERVAAQPGDMSIISVAAQLHFEVSKGWLVPAKLFTPPPKVDSQVLILKKRQAPLFPNLDSKRFFQIVKAGFAGRRKTLSNSLSAGLHLSKEATNERLQKAGINPGLRAQALSLEDWNVLYKAFK
jgi:16S rRNA (adenine1518-N6/adenine1519-N6)-dimethyltransferase